MELDDEPPPDEPPEDPEEPEEPPDEDGIEGAGMLGDGIVGIIKGLIQPVSKTEIAAAAPQSTAFGRHRLAVVSADAFIVCAPELTSEGTRNFPTKFGVYPAFNAVYSRLVRMDALNG
jgi:hypothetical protein